jgi:hypothetical protein
VIRPGYPNLILLTFIGLALRSIFPLEPVPTSVWERPSPDWKAKLAFAYCSTGCQG